MLKNQSTKQAFFSAFVMLSMLLAAFSASSQTINDYRTISSGAWTNSAIWEKWNGTTWAATTYPNANTANVQIVTGHIVTVPTPGPYNVANITVDPTGKLYSGQATTNVYLNIFGSNIICNGQIGDGLNSDGLAFNMEAVNTTISGVGQFVSCRIRKSATTNVITDLVIAMDVTLRWNSASFTQLYNNTSASSRFNVTVNYPYILYCEGSPGLPGNLTIDGVSGTGAADAGGTITVNGTLIVPGVLFAASNNPTNIAYTTGTGAAGATTITVSQTVGLVVGQRISGTGIGANATITAIVGTTVTLSVANTAAVSGALSILPASAPSISGGTGSTNITVSSSAGLYVGQSISGTNIASGAMITAISGTTLTLSAANIGPVTGYATVGNSCNFIVNNGGVMKVGSVYSPAGTAAGFMNFTVKNGGKLELTGAQGFPAGTANWSTTNNRYNFETGSTVEYSFAGNQSVLQQSDFVSSVTFQNYYWHLVISGSGTKTIRPGTMIARGDITITGGSAVLDQNTSGPDIRIGGSWSNYNQSGFAESTNPLRSVKFTSYTGSTAIQLITCPGGENFYNLWVAKTGVNNLVELRDNVTVTNVLSLGEVGQSTNGVGVIRLNGKTLTLTNSLPTAIKIQGNAGILRYLVSEFPSNTSRVNWNIGSSTGTYIIPFGQNSLSDTLPFYYIKNNPTDIGQLSVSTYGTPSINLPWPTTPVPITNLLSLYSSNNTPDNRLWTVDRYWYVGVTTPAPSTVVFTYDQTELPDSVTTPSDMRAQYWNAPQSTWELPQLGNTGTAGYPTYSVKVDTFQNYNTNWTLSAIQSPLYNVPLPVELLRFSAKPYGDDVLVDWVTATETNNDHFDIERSDDGIHFNDIGTVAGAGTSSMEHRYEWIDQQPLTGISYYRLRQTDYDGKFSHSEIVAVDRTRTKGKSLLVAPNPARSETTVFIDADIPGTLTLRVTDSRGALVYQSTVLPASQNRIPIDLSGLSNGIYTVSIDGNYVNDRLRLVKE
ncbi:MAG: T9SS type A sorting domain-containing protein [Bacteroidota bacterium]